MNNSARIRVALLAAALLVVSCVGKDSPTGVGRGGGLAVPVQPALIPTPADAGAAPINLIRARVARIPDGAVIGESTTEVDPTAEQWEIELTADPGLSGTVLARIFLSLINVSGGVETVQFSGLADSIPLTAGGLAEPTDVPILRGPIANFYTTALQIESVPDTLVEGTSAPLAAAVETSGETTPTVFWSALLACPMKNPARRCSRSPTRR